MSDRTAGADQIGGTHYSELGIDPVTYCMANALGCCEFSVVKYVTRWRAKGGLEDLHKARHFLQILIDYETEQAQAQMQ